jgi:hypothetical protein
MHLLVSTHLRISVIRSLPTPFCMAACLIEDREGCSFTGQCCPLAYGKVKTKLVEIPQNGSL